MRKLVVLLTLVCMVGIAGAQTFQTGDKVLNLGLGLGNGFYRDSYYTSKVPPVSLSLEYGVADGILDKGSIGVGGYLGYTSAKSEWFNGADKYGWKYTNMIIGARGLFHYPLVPKLDTYTGLLMGYDIVTAKEYGTWPGGTTYTSNASAFIWSWYLGGRYYFNDKVAGMIEFGYGISYLNLGLAFKL